MQLAISAVTSDLVSRFISFLSNKCKEHVYFDDKLARLQHLLLRVHTVVEEADGRYITNSSMLVQFKMLVEGMYQGYHMLDTRKYKILVETVDEEEVSHSSILSFLTLVKCSRTIDGTTKSIAVNHKIHEVLRNLENILADMTEFITLLGGCERMVHRSYDSYLYIDNFMFSRHVEKQQIINFLLENPSHFSAPTVLPVIGGCRVGKKTLVEHVCNDWKVRSHFSSILRICQDSIRRMDGEKFIAHKILVVVEFLSDVGNEEWINFFSSLTCVGEGSKVIIISRLERIARFGTVKPIRLNSLSHEEYSYLFKMLAFGSANPVDHPQLVSIGNKLATVLGGSLITGNVVADMLRRNLTVQFWLHILRRFWGMVKSHLLKFGEHPKNILDNNRPIDISIFASPSSTAPLRVMPPRVERDYDVSKIELSRVMLGDLIKGGVALPKEEFEIVAWESRIPPYTRLVHFVAVGTEEKPEDTALARKRRRFDK